jgi:cytochrome c oxidase subunit II
MMFSNNDHRVEKSGWSSAMTQPKNRPLKRVLIASANPLFAKGLEKIYGDRWGKDAVELRLANSMGETLSRLESWNPDLVIVDYDDRTIHREEFLSHFIAGDRPMQVMLVSLQASGEVVVYDRRTLTPAQAEDWLNLPWQTPPQPPQLKRSEKLMKGSAKHFVIAGLLVVVSTILIDLLLSSIGLLPVEASKQATIIDPFFRAHFFMIALLFSMIAVFIGYSIVVFRAKPGDKSSGVYFKGNSRLEVVWTVVPLVVVIGFAFYGARNLSEVRAASSDAMLVKVVAGQWNWQFEYPDFGIKSKELYLPVNRQVLFQMTSRDVIHSFWVPEFRVKQDILPGANLVKELRVTPIRLGSYKLLCAELCGGAHADMTAPVVVVSQADFQKWASTQLDKSVKVPAERGKTYLEASGCVSCHSLDGSRLVGPSFKGLYGSMTELTDGSSLGADADYLRKSILDPNSQIVKGFAPNLMPLDYGKQLTDEQLNDIIEFVKTLK